jgi:hypothetical protein
MAKKYPGLYLYSDWMRGLEKLPVETAWQIVRNLYHYAEEDLEPAPLEELQYTILQDIYMEQLRRSKHRSEVNRENVRSRYDRPKDPLRDPAEKDTETLTRMVSESPLYEEDDPNEIMLLYNAREKGLRKLDELSRDAGPKPPIPHFTPSTGRPR